MLNRVTVPRRSPSAKPPGFLGSATPKKTTAAARPTTIPTAARATLTTSLCRQERHRSDRSHREAPEDAFLTVARKRDRNHAESDRGDDDGQRDRRYQRLEAREPAELVARSAHVGHRAPNGQEHQGQEDRRQQGAEVAADEPPFIEHEAGKTRS